MTEKRFTTNGCYVYDHQKEDKWLANEVEIGYIVTVMNNLDTKAKEKSKALSTLQKKFDALHEENRELQRHVDVMRSGALTDDRRIKELYDENEQLKNNIKEAYNNERTMIGKSVLKQLMETIQ